MAKPVFLRQVGIGMLGQENAIFVVVVDGREKSGERRGDYRRERNRDETCMTVVTERQDADRRETILLTETSCCCYQ